MPCQVVLLKISGIGGIGCAGPDSSFSQKAKRVKPLLVHLFQILRETWIGGKGLGGVKPQLFIELGFDESQAQLMDPGRGLPPSLTP